MLRSENLLSRPLTVVSFRATPYLLGDARDDLLPYLDDLGHRRHLFHSRSQQRCMPNQKCRIFPKAPSFSPRSGRRKALSGLTVYARNTGRPPVGDTAISIICRANWN